MDLDAAFQSNSSYEIYAGNDSVVEDDYHVPYEIPNCPAKSSMLNLYYYTDNVIETFLYSKTDKVMITIMFPLIVTLGFLANCAFLFTLVRVRQMRTITNFYLANLGLADLFFVIVTAVNYFYKYTWSPDFQRGVPWSSTVGCAAISSAIYMPYFASICLVTLVSLERFLAICFPLKHRMMNNKSRTLKMVLATWLTSLAFTAVVAPTYAKHVIYCIVWPDKWQHRLPAVINYCNTVKVQFIDIAAVFQFAPFILALFLNTILYALIIIRLSQRDVSDKGDEKSVLQNQAMKVRNAVARMLVINGIAFFLCLAPYQFYNMYYFVARNCGKSCSILNDNHVYIIGWIGRCLNVLNSAINPVIYSATNERYRQAFITAVGCTPKKRNVSEMPTSVTGVAVTGNTSTRM